MDPQPRTQSLKSYSDIIALITESDRVVVDQPKPIALSPLWYTGGIRNPMNLAK